MVSLSTSVPWADLVDFFTQLVNLQYWRETQVLDHLCRNPGCPHPRPRGLGQNEEREGEGDFTHTHYADEARLAVSTLSWDQRRRD